ncbi:MAG: Tad domain-containing protein [Salaquimonas sp.]
MTNIVKTFLKSEGGNFATIFGLVLTPVLMTAGVAADYAGFKRMEGRMQLSAEAAMLAGSKEVIRIRDDDYADDGVYDMTNAEIVAELDAVFKPHFEANFAAGGYELSADQYTLEYIEADNNTKVLVTMNYDTAIMRAFGYNTMTASREMVINLKVQPHNYVLDLVMCIDATGSMQNTLDAVKENAATFNADLREELGVGPESQKLKIRIRPIFYRDWEEGETYNNAMVGYNADLAAHAAWEAEYGDVDESDLEEEETSGVDPDVREDFHDEWDDSNWYYKDGRKWERSKKSWHPKTHKRIKVNRKKYYFASIEELDAWIDENYGDWTGGGSGGGTTSIPAEPTIRAKPVNHGLNIYGDFIDLDPNDSTGDTKEDQNAEFENFLGSTHAFGGHDWPEAAGACLNEAIRSNWYDNQSDDAREYFGINSTDLIIDDNDEVPAEAYSKVTPVPIIVFWSDATINSLQKSRDYLSPTTPTSYSTFKSLWEGTIPASDPDTAGGVTQSPSGATGRPVIDQDYKMLIRFGPSGASGFTTLDTWDRTYYGGSLSTGNSEAVKVIAKKILDSIPDLLRVGS